MDKFSTNESIALERAVIFEKNPTPTDDPETVYELQRCIEWITDNDFKKVCLQFPDKLLHDSASVALHLQAALGFSVYILGDTSYESCCVDYVAAAHVPADAVIHFGASCLSQQTHELPTLMIHEKYPLCIESLAKCIRQYRAEVPAQSQICIVFDTQYVHQADVVVSLMRDSEFKVYNAIYEDLVDFDKNAHCLYVGEDNRKMTVFNLKYRPLSMAYFKNGSLVKYELNQTILKRRNYLTERIKDAKTLAIVIGTLAVSKYLNAINRVKALCRARDKKYYVLSVGKVNVAKLANFPEMDVYILISCPMNEIFDSRDFYRPMVTVHDVEVALNETSDISFSYEFDQILFVPIQSHIKENSGGDVSLLSGSVRVSEPVEEHSAAHGQLMLREEGSMQVATKDNFVRSWHGLDRDGDGNEPTLAEKGRSGLAAGYSDESADASPKLT